MLLSVVLVSIIYVKVTSQNIDFIKDYLNHSHIKTALFITCENAGEMMKIISELHSTDSYVNVWNIKHDDAITTLNYTQFFVRLESPHTIVSNLNCEHVADFLNQSSKRTLFHLERTWLFFSNNLSQSYEILGQENVNLDADITVVVPLENSYQINDAYNPSKLRGGRLNITTIGKWDKRSGIQLSTEQTKIERRRNLGGLKFIGVVTLPSPLPNSQTFIEHLQSIEFPQVNSLDRSSYKLFELMMEMYNFDLLIHRTKHWMGVDVNGNWTGTLGMVQRGEVDVAITGVRHENDRYGQVEATTHCYFVQITFIFQHPKSINASNIFLSPLNDAVWLIVLLFSLFIAVSLRQSFWLENKRRSSDHTYSNSLLMVFGIMFQQGYGSSTHRLSSKLLTITVLFFSFVLFQFYSSFIISSLLTEAPKTIKTMSQLLKSKLECVLDDVPYILDNLRHSQDESAKQIYEQVVKDPETRIVSVPRGLDLIKQHGFALNTDASYAYPKLKEILSDKEICNLQEVTYIRKIAGHPAVTLKSPFRELIKIRKFSETGIMSHHWDIWIGKKPKCQNSDIDVVEVDWMHFSSSVYMLLAGIEISVAVLLVEMFVNSYHKRRAKLKKKLGHRNRMLDALLTSLIQNEIVEKTNLPSYTQTWHQQISMSEMEDFRQFRFDRASAV